MEMSRAIEYFVQWGQRKYTNRTVEIYVGHLRRFLRYTGDKSIEEVHLFDDVIAYARKLEKGGASDNTVNLAMTALRQLWRAMFNLERQLKITVPFRPEMIPIKNLVVAKSHKPITEEQYESLLLAIESATGQQPFIRIRDRAMFALLHDTGLRVSELVDLDVKSLDMERRSVSVVTRKRTDRMKEREVYWTEETHMLMLRFLERRREWTNTEPLFFSVSHLERITTRSVQRSLKYYLRAAKIDPSSLSPHSFRHGVGRRAAAQQMYPPLLQAYLGHRNPNSSQVYYNVQNERLRHEYHTKLGDLRTEKVLKAVIERPVEK